MNSEGFSCSVLMCHAPIVIPEFASNRADLCKQSTNAMQAAASLLVERKPDVVVVLSPHTPRFRDSFILVEGPELHGHFGQFGRADLRATFSTDCRLQNELATLAKQRDLSLRLAPQQSLDHGALVPLFFLNRAGYRGQVLVLGFPYDSRPEQNRKMGALLADLARNHSDKRWALLASGDMSHRLSPGAPAGFHPNASRFDRVVSKCVECGKYEEVSSIDSDLRELAAEDVVDSLEIAAAALEGRDCGKKFLSYEGPFGVGYLVAVLCDSTGDINE